ncbi:subtilisin-like protease SBT5.4 [Nymphaea colorata]|nr:subtilisin-like protease SBT5.4 [Nymphaea colorata]
MRDFFCFRKKIRVADMDFSKFYVLVFILCQCGKDGCIKWSSYLGSRKRRGLKPSHRSTEMGKLIFLLVALFFAPAFALQKSYIVYLGAHSHDSPDNVDHKLVADSHHEFLASFLGSKEKAKDAVFCSYTNHINGFAAQLDEDAADAIAKHPSVISVFPSRAYSLHTTRTWEFMDLAEKDGIPLLGSAWAMANFGEDVIIANLDTGVWPESKSFSDEGFGPVPARWKGFCQNATDANGVKCNRKLIGARYFDKGYANFVHHHDTEGFHSPRDHDGHGSHTLSTAGGSLVPNASVFGNGMGTAKGGSPRARVAAYKVCWTPLPDGGECFDVDILAAFDTAIADGVDVISVSLGGFPYDYVFDGIAIGSLHAVSNGITVVASAGNDGPRSSSVTNVAPWLFTVGASTFDREFVSYVTLGNNITIKGESISPALPKRSYPLVAGQDVKLSNATAATLCVEGSLDPVKTKGKIVACLRGANARVGKGYEVWRAGGAGMILCNDALSGNELVADAHFVPASHVTATDGQKIFEYISSTKSPVAYIAPPIAKLGTRPSPVMAAFSSQGPNSVTPEILKPDVTAPGVNVLAAYSMAASPTGFAVDKRHVPYYLESGTSMSCPHVSGVVGLIKKAHPDWSPAAIKSAIMTTASQRDNTMEPILNASLVEATPFSYGAGHIQPNRAIDPGLVYDIGVEDYLNFLCAIGYNTTYMTFIANQTYVCSSKVPKVGDFNYPSITFINLTTSATVWRTVKNVGAPGTYKVQIESPPGVVVSVMPNSLKFSAVGEEKKFKVTAQVKEGARDGYAFGSLIWLDGKHYVRSPITVEVGTN